MIELRLFGHSVTGRRRNNEDNFIVKYTSWGGCLMAVADGMGGAAGGEVASALVIDVLYKSVNSITVSKPEQLKPLLQFAFEKIQQVLQLRLAEEPDLKGFGSTLVCMLIFQDCYVWANIGDSRLYHINPTGIRLLTNDHTYVNELVENGNPNAAVLQKYGHVLTRAVDGGQDKIDLFPVEHAYDQITENELFIACSDGAILDKSLQDHRWLQNLAIKSLNLRNLVNNTIEFAYTSGSTDNITVAGLSAGFRFSPPMIITHHNTTDGFDAKKTFFSFVNRLREVSVPILAFIITIVIFLTLYLSYRFYYQFNEINKSGIVPERELLDTFSSQTIDLSSSDSLFLLTRKADSLIQIADYEKALTIYQKLITNGFEDPYILKMKKEMEDKVNGLKEFQRQQRDNQVPDKGQTQQEAAKPYRDSVSKQSQDSNIRSLQTEIVLPVDSNQKIKVDTTKVN